MAWQYDQPGILYDQPGLEYDSDGSIVTAVFEYIVCIARRKMRR